MDYYTACRLLLVICLCSSVNGNLLDLANLGNKVDQTINDESNKNVMHQHGGVKMGVKTDACDNGEDNLETDWDPNGPNASKSYTCLGPYILNTGEKREMFCQEKFNPPLHECMNTKIVYKDRIPLSGSHRPLWPVYGEYIYLPPQRWLHSLEHGAAVFLYHPCADKEQIELLKQLARNCLRKHIITPYNKLQRSRPFAIVTWGCRLTMERLTDDAVYDAVTFIKETAVRDELPEGRVWHDGQYNKTLIQKANIVSDLYDSFLCPVYSLN